MKITIAILTFAFAAGGASADPKKLKAEFLCGIYVDGKITKPIKGGKVGKLTDTIACALHLADPEEPGHAVHVRTLHNGTEITNVTGVVNEGGVKDFEIFLKPNEAFKPCEAFEIAVGIFDPGGQYKKSIKVQPTCPKPAAIRAELTCLSEYMDGTAIKFPQTKKLKGRIEKEITCTVYAKKVPDDAKLTGAVWIKGKTPHKDQMADTAPEGQKVDASLEPGTDFEPCSGKLTVLASLVDADGAQRWTGKLDIPAQFCPD